MAVLEGLEPQEVFRWFEAICGIPHGSSDTGRISDFLVDFAVQRGLKYRQDEWNNVIIWKAASPGSGPPPRERPHSQSPPETGH